MHCIFALDAMLMHLYSVEHLWQSAQPNAGLREVKTIRVINVVMATWRIWVSSLTAILMLTAKIVKQQGRRSRSIKRE
jgi:hypothetical protein